MREGEAVQKIYQETFKSILLLVLICKPEVTQMLLNSNSDVNQHDNIEQVFFRM